jgi:hypothetical protein
MKKSALIALALLTASLPALAQPAPNAPASAPAGKTFSVEGSTIGELLDNPAARAVFAKHLPDVIVNPQLDQGRPLTLPQIVQYVPTLTPEKLAAIDADLKALPPQ